MKALKQGLNTKPSSPQSFPAWWPIPATGEISTQAGHLFREDFEGHEGRIKTSLCGHHRQQISFDHFTGETIWGTVGKISQLQQTNSDRREQPQKTKEAFDALELTVLKTAAGLEALMRVFNGTITNDKFCMSRLGRLQLSWWRLPRCARLPVPQQIGYPSETTKLESCSQEDTYEKTSVDDPASRCSNGGCETSMGSRLSSSDPMECGFFERASTGAP